MYIRIQNQTIKYRVSRAEAQQLLSHQKLQDEVALSPHQKMGYAVETCDNESYFDYVSDTNLMALHINRADLKDELEDRPSKQGILIRESNSETLSPAVYLEIDLKKSKRSQL
ncbi:DUF7009 family protein [Aliikangiella coralliicola]|uniref:Uncharacterized protein n=1 Tax=Aliikangiella coralliicola TaxID=2592383 RepID=A0A545UDK9_9GAMM|nr:hypothetical protein [Aliikangiella coralliicola]TQV87523.1 hypothetical protein FLL46_11660 [Aliikangiella coralliicola]